ncbi:MAG: glycosyltransferase family 2 protein [Nocardioides sp.]|nr:glycosyltransferase family 2 protein [Nocardioides sp.]
MSVTSERIEAGNVATATRPTRPRVSVVVPALNEARNLELVLSALPSVHEVILVDGGSVDGTVATARRLMPDIRVIRQRRHGKGNALAAGFAEVTGDVVVTFDANGSADPHEIPRFVAALVDGADFAKGSRLRRRGSAWPAGITSRVLGKELSDLCYGYNAFWADLAPMLDLPDHELPAPRHGEMLWGDGFEIETVINCRFAAAEAVITEVPVTGVSNGQGVGAFHVARAGLRVLWTLLRERRRVPVTRAAVVS